MPLPSNGLPTPLADMKDLYGIAEPDSTSSSKSESESKATSATPASSSKLSSMISSFLGRKDNNSRASTTLACDSQVTLTAATEPDVKADAGAKS